MRDLMEELNQGTDTHLKAKGSKLTRLDLLNGQLDRIVANLDEAKKIITIVYEGNEFVEKVAGTLKDTKEIVEYYDQNFVLGLGSRKKINAIIVRLIKPIAKSADIDEEE